MSNLTFTNVSKVGLLEIFYQYVCAPSTGIIYAVFFDDVSFLLNKRNAYLFLPAQTGDAKLKLLNLISFPTSL